MKIILIILFIFVIGGGLYGIFHKRKPEFPTHIDDLSTFEYEKLKLAATAPTSKDSAAIGVSNHDPVHNRIYVSSNAKEGTVLLLSIEEVPGTVVDPRAQTIKFKLRPIFEHLTQSQPLSLSPGGYQLSISSLSSPTVLAQRQLFLGGVEDQNYKKQLTEAQGRRRQEATFEEKELLEDFARFQKSEQILKSFVSLKGNDTRQIEKLELQWNTLKKETSPRDFSKTIYSKTFQKIRGMALDLDQVYSVVQREVTKPHAQIPPQFLEKRLTKFDSELASWRSEIGQLDPGGTR